MTQTIKGALAAIFLTLAVLTLASATVPAQTPCNPSVEECR